ncbi:hypothetical protein N431DRAFT_173720 [Stipitochalara longipes BDJ]|nr:hypothetical protein N431DRAFT_173720 [Stipitochalara longipes BDJ]
MTRTNTWNLGHNGLDMHDDAPPRMGLRCWGLFTVFGVKLVVLNRASTGMRVRIKHSTWLHPASDLFVDLAES